MLTELLIGGEAFQMLRPPFGDQVRLTRSQARFYAGSVLLALEALFDGSIVYRDPKHENVTRDFRGYTHQDHRLRHLEEARGGDRSSEE